MTHSNKLTGETRFKVKIKPAATWGDTGEVVQWVVYAVTFHGLRIGKALGVGDTIKEAIKDFQKKYIETQ